MGLLSSIMFTHTFIMQRERESAEADNDPISFSGICVFDFIKIVKPMLSPSFPPPSLSIPFGQ